MKEKESTEIRKTPTIGLFIDWIDSPFQFQMLEGINAGAKKYGFNFYCFAGGAIKSTSLYERARNFIYDYAVENIIDGLIMISTSVGHYVSTEEMNRFRAQYPNIPVVSLLKKLDNSYTVQTDNIIGFKLLINHLIKTHGYQNIAVIKGPENHPETHERFSAYREALEENGISLNEELVVPGLFTEQSGYDAGMFLLAKKNCRIEAIVAFNDDMAYGAIRAIRQMGLSVPYDIAVVGFDDQPQSRYFSPSLSTVKMPISHIGFRAVEVLHDIFNSIPVEPLIVLPAKPVFRESCGCILHSPPVSKENAHLFMRDAAQDLKDQNEEYPLVQKMGRVFEFFCESLNPRDSGFSEEEIRRFTELYIASIHEKEADALITYFSTLLNQRHLSEREIDYLFGFFLNQKNRILDFFEAQAEKTAADEQLQMICQYLFNHTKKDLNYNLIKLEREIIRFRYFGGELVVCSNTDQIIEMLLQAFPILEINTFYLSLYQEEENNPDKLKPDLQMILAYGNRKRIDIDDPVIYDPYETLVPKQYLDNTKRWSLLIEPIFFGSTKLGLAIFDMKMEGYIYYVMRRRVLNDALNYAVYVQRVLNQSRNLEKTNDELSRTLNILKETQEKLIQSERMSAIGNLVAGISHEINTPIGISVTAASHLEQITREISELHTTNNLKKSDFEKYLKMAEEISAMILANLHRAHELIGSFKQVAVDQSSEERRKFKVKEYVDRILVSLSPALKKTELSIAVECQEDLELLSYPGAFSQIITNFVMNSVIHGYDKGQKGNVAIEIAVENNQALLKYADDGKGISPEIIAKIFDPFVTTRRGQGGTGLGLHIVYNLVTQKLNGSIKCESPPGGGAAFVVTFPIGE